MSQRNLRIGRRTQRRRDAGNNLKFDVGLAQGFDLFSGAPEDERVTALEPNYLQSQQRILNQQRIDFFLADAFVSEALADVVELG